MLKKIISGGQTGADVAGLEAGLVLGLETGGVMPKGYRTDDGDRPDFATRFGVTEHWSRNYPPRTAENVKAADGTVIFGNSESPGCRLTRSLCYRLYRPCMVNPSSPEILRVWVEENHIATLNVAGNRERTNPGIGHRVQAFLINAFQATK